MSEQVDYLITGVTGGLGGSIATHLLARVPASSVALASSNPGKPHDFQQRFPGTQFRHVDYSDEASLERALTGVKRFFFVSTNTFDPVLRSRQHLNVIQAAKAVGVEHTFYSSLAFCGFSSDYVTQLMEAHIETEKFLATSGIPYTSVRVGLYAEAFPLYLNWYPHSREIYLPAIDGVPLDGPVAWAKRDELGEALAILMSEPQLRSFKDTNNIAVLSGPAAYSLTETISTLGVATPSSPTSHEKPEIKYIPADEYADFMFEYDKGEKRGGKGVSFFTLWLSTFKGLTVGEGAYIDPLMETLLGRKPMDGLEYIRELVNSGGESGRGFLWHQNGGSV